MAKILFRVDANNKIGWGHFYRSLALAEMLKESFSIVFAMAEPCMDLVTNLKEKSIQVIKLPFQEYCSPDERGNKELQFDLYGKLSDVNIVVLDGYWFGPKYQSELRKYSIKVVIIEDDGEGTYFADLIINHAPDTQKYRYHTDNKDTDYAIGPNYALLRPSFLKAAKEKHRVKSSINNVLIAFGGSDQFNFTAKLLNWFIENTDVSLHVIIGAGYEHQHSLNETISIDPSRITLDRNLREDQMVAAMKSADAAVLPASGVLFESIACRLPAISGTYTKNQEAIFNGFLTKGVIINGGDFSNLTEAWSYLRNSDLADLRIKHASLIDGYSGERLRLLFTMLTSENKINIRPAKIEDMKLYFYWANDENVRSNAFKQNTIELGRHKLWFGQKLVSKLSKLFVLECSDIPLGQIRFDKDDDGYWKIDYSVDFRFRGMGFGSVLVKKGVDCLKDFEAEVKIKAEVKSGNASSIRVFRKMEFQESFRDAVFYFTMN